MRIPFLRQISWYLIIVFFIIGITPKVEAGISPSELIAMSQVDRAADIEKIQKIIEIKMVRERLENFGFTQEEIQKRLNNLSDQQLHKLALQIDDIKVGSDGVGIVLVLLIIALTIILVLQLTGHRVIVTK